MTEFMSFDREANVIRGFVSGSRLEKDISLLDVGCGYGRNLRSLAQDGVTIVGVDANKDAIEQNRRNGFDCYLPADDGWKRCYDVILMSHIIEHFSPAELTVFMDGYLRHLAPGGRLIIATPMLTNYFFEDFTHIKPYFPESILMIFGDLNPQVSYRSDVRLELRDLWFRTSAYKVRWVRGRYLYGNARYVIRGLNGVLAVLHWASFGFFGKKDGWVGVFQKVSQ